MIGNIRQFKQDVYNKCDSRARLLVMEYMNSHSPFHFIFNPDQYGIDLVTTTNPVYGIEVEHRKPWKEDSFPFAETHIPARKQDRLKDGINAYAIVNATYDRIAIISPKNLSMWVDNVWTNTSPNYRQGEYYIEIPWAYFKIHEIRPDHNL